MNKFKPMLSAFSTAAVVLCLASTAPAQETRTLPEDVGKFLKGDESAVGFGFGKTMEDIDGNVHVFGDGHIDNDLFVDSFVHLTAKRVEKGSTLRVEGDAEIGSQLTVGGLTVSGVATMQGLTVPSSRRWKYDVSELTSSDALTLLEELNPVAFKFKEDDSAATHFGFIAEEVPAVLAGSDRQGYRPFEIIAVLTKALQEQQTMIQALQEQIRTLKPAADHD